MAPRAADPQPLVEITLKKQWQLATSAPRRFQLPKAGWKLGAVWLWGRCQTVGAQRARAPLTSAMAAGAEVMWRGIKMVGLPCTMLLGGGPHKTFKPCWKLEQTHKQKIKAAKR